MDIKVHKLLMYDDAVSTYDPCNINMTKYYEILSEIIISYIRTLFTIKDLILGNPWNDINNTF